MSPRVRHERLHLAARQKPPRSLARQGSTTHSRFPRHSFYQAGVLSGGPQGRRNTPELLIHRTAVGSIARRRTSPLRLRYTQTVSAPAPLSPARKAIVAACPVLLISLSPPAPPPSAPWASRPSRPRSSPPSPCTAASACAANTPRS